MSIAKLRRPTTKGALVILIALLALSLLAAPSVQAADQSKPKDSGGLEVVSITPKGEVQRLTQVTVRFSRPMRPLGDMSQPAAGAPLKIHPRPEGQYRWLDPQTLAYILKTPIGGASSFNVTVPGGIKSLDGSHLAGAVRVRITTPPVKWLRVSPGKKTLLPPTPQFRLTFNQPLDLESFKQRVRLELAGKPLKIKVRELPGRGGYRLPKLAAAYQVVCLDRLPPDADVKLRVRPGVKPAAGTIPSAINYAVNYKSYGTLKLVRFRMNRTPDGKLNPEDDLTLYFSNPVVPREVWKHLSFDPPLKPKSKPGTAPTRYVSADVDFKPRAMYKMRITPGLVDAYGTTMKTGTREDLQMGDLPPIFSLAAEKGVMEAGLPAAYPLRVRNLAEARLALTFLDMDSAVPALVKAADRPWDKAPEWPDKGQSGVSLHRLTFPDKPNQAQIHMLDLARLLGRSPRGGMTLVDLRAMLPDSKGEPKERIRTVFLQVTDLALTLKLGETSSLAWVTSLGQGAVLAGVELELRDRDNKVLWSGTSDEHGTAMLPSLAELKPKMDKDRPWRAPLVYLLAKHGEDLAVLPAEWGEDLQYSMPGKIDFRNPGLDQGLMAHAITQLPLYQPGQEVRFVVYLRREGEHRLQAADGVEVKLVVMDSYGREVRTFKGATDAYGAAGGTVKLGSTARLGAYRIKVVVGKKELYAGTFRVASFRPPDFKLAMTAPDSEVGARPGLKASVEAMYHFGSPLSGVGAALRVSQKEAYFSPALLDDYAVGGDTEPNDRPNLRRTLGTVEAKLDAGGRAVMKIPPAQPLPGYPVTVLLEAEVSDASQRKVVTRRSMLVHPASVYVGLKTPYLSTIDKPTQIELAAATHDNKPVASQTVSLKIYHQVWETVRERGPGGFYNYLSKIKRTQVFSTQATVGAGPVKVSFTPKDTGTYVAVAEAKDAAGRATTSGMYFYAAGQRSAGWEQHDDHRLDLVTDDKPLSPGQMARIMIKSPFKEATALVTVERAGVRRVVVRRISGQAPVIEVPVRAGDAPAAYAGVLLIRGRNAGPPDKGPDLGKPQVRFGYVVLKVNNPFAGLKVAVTTDQAKVEPGAKITATAQVTNMAGKPVRCQVTMLAVDERVLSAAGGATNYDPNVTFDKMRPLSVLTADMRTQVLGRRFMGAKGEDAAGGGAPASPALRRKFHPAVYWLAQAETDDQGKLSATFTLPDTLTAYRIVVVAADKNGNFGNGRAKVIASRPVQLLSALPRFAVAGDEFTARVLVQNLSGAPGKAMVTAKAEGMTLTGARSLTLDLAVGQTGTAAFPVAVGEGAKASLTVQVKMGPHADAAMFTLPIVYLTELTTAAAAGGLNPAAGKAQAVIPLKLPADAAKGRGGLKVVVSPSLASALKAPADTVLAYPWECLEQRTSKAAVRGLRLVHGDALGLKPAADDKKALAEAMGAVGDFQTGGGGMTLWPGVGNPSMYVTAYVLLVNQEIKGSGAALDAKLVERAVKYLELRLRQDRAPKAEELWKRIEEATAILALAREGRKVRAALEAAAGRAKGLSPFGLAALIEASHLMKMDDLTAKLITELETTIEISAAEMHFTFIHPGWLKPVMGSTLRGNAMALMALSRAKPDYPRLDALARWVAARLGERRYLSTQEGVFGLWGLAAYLGETGKETDLTVTVEVDQRQMLEQKYDDPKQAPVTVEVLRDLLAPGKQATVAVKAEGKGRPHWTARLSYAPTRPGDQSENAGFNLSRAYRIGKDGKSADPTLGQQVEVTLTLHVSATRHHVLVHDPFPAGLEPPEPAAGAPSGGGSQGYVWRWRELRRDRLLLYAPTLLPGVYTFTYKLRAVAPGNFRMKRAKAEEMYSPEVFGLSTGGYLKVGE